MKKLQKSLFIVFIILNINSFSQATWTGSSNGSWDDASNWSSNTLPSSSTDVVISASKPLYRVVGSSPVCNNLTINAGARLTVRNGDNLHVFGNLIIKTPNDNSPSGSLIDYGNLIVDDTVKFERNYSVDNKWQYICSPLNNTNSDLFTNSSSPYFNPNFIRYNQAYDCIPDPSSQDYTNWSNTDLVNAWEHHHNGEGGAAVNLELGLGYAFASDKNVVIEYSGNTQSVINNTDVNIPVTYNGNDGNSGYFDGWNLVGNPFTSAIDWGHRQNQSGDSITNTAYCWSSVDKQYKYINGNGASEAGDGSNVVNGNTGFIAAGQGFFVKATCTNSGSGHFRLARGLRRHNSQDLWKKNKNEDKNINNKKLPQYIKFRIEDNGFSDETVIRFIDDATVDFDNEYDAFKLAVPNEEVPAIFSASEDLNTIMAINSLPYPDDYEIKAIPLFIKTYEAKQYTILLKQSEYSDLDIFLKDNYENKLMDLKKINRYTFNYAGGLNKERFVVFYKSSSATEIDDAKLMNNTLIYPNPSSGEFSLETFEQANSLLIFDITGRIIKIIENPSLKTKINISGNKKGVYFIKINYQNYSVSKKLIIQ